MHATCHIIYHLDSQYDWKSIELSIIDIEYCQTIIPNKKTTAGRAEVLTFQILVSHFATHGFYHAFHEKPDTFISEIFDKIANADAFKKADFGLENKIISLISKHGLII